VPPNFRVDEEVQAALTDGRLPEAVARALADDLERFAGNPAEGTVNDPVIGPVHMFEYDHADNIWRIAFTVACDENGQPIGISSMSMGGVH
jgi:hypothetical protein